MLQQLTDFVLYNVFNLSPTTPIANFLSFFIYDSLKIFLMLFFMITIVGIIRSYISKEAINKILAQKHPIISYFIIALFGSLTPFCSCSSIPLFLGFIKTGIPLGIAFTFLVTSPLINEYLVVLMIGFFGLKITILYIISGLMIGIISGYIIGKLNLEKNINPDFITPDSDFQEIKFVNFKSRVLYGVQESLAIINNIWKWIVIAVAIGAIIHNYVPQEAIQSIIAKGGVFLVPITVLLGVPMYGGCASIVPIALALFKKGAPLGTALSFMMSVSALSLPEAIILKKAMDRKLIIIFFSIVFLGIVFTGYFFNIISCYI